MSSNFKRLIEALIEEEFSQAPQMGDIDPTAEDDKDRPLLDKRPDGGGMDVSQHHKMMWAEDVQARNYHDEYSESERLVDIVLMRRGMGQEIEDIVDGLKDKFSVEDIYLAYNAAKMLESAGNDDNDQEVIEEMSAISGGGAGLASAGKVSATSAGSAWKSNNPEHELMWSGDAPHSKRPNSPNAKKKRISELVEELIGTAKNGAPSYFQMGSSLPDKFYNQDDDSGKATRDPGIRDTDKKKTKREGISAGAPPKLSDDDIEDALEHSSYELGGEDSRLYNVDFVDFDFKYLGKLSMDDLRYYDDIDSWMEDIDDEEELIGFRGPKWAAKATSWRDDIPPIVIITSENPPYSAVGDGRGRITYANYKGLSVPAWELAWKGTVLGKAIRDTDKAKKKP